MAIDGSDVLLRPYGERVVKQSVTIIHMEGTLKISSSIERKGDETQKRSGQLAAVSKHT